EEDETPAALYVNQCDSDQSKLTRALCVRCVCSDGPRQRLLTGDDAHPRAGPGAQGDRGVQSENLAGLGGQAMALDERRKQENRFHHGEVVADADPRPVVEREIRAAREPSGEVAIPALGAERLGIVEPAWVAVQDPLGDQELRPLRDIVAPELE